MTLWTLRFDVNIEHVNYIMKETVNYIRDKLLASFNDKKWVF